VPLVIWVDTQECNLYVSPDDGGGYFS
jgi:hypothetical protein